MFANKFVPLAARSVAFAHARSSRAGTYCVHPRHSDAAGAAGSSGASSTSGAASSSGATSSSGTTSSFGATSSGAFPFDVVPHLWMGVVVAGVICAFLYPQGTMAAGVLLGGVGVILSGVAFNVVAQPFAAVLPSAAASVSEVAFTFSNVAAPSATLMAASATRFVDVAAPSIDRFVDVFERAAYDAKHTTYVAIGVAVLAGCVIPLLKKQ